MNSTNMPPIHITCSGVTKRYIRDTVLKEATFEAHAGEVIAITGPNGSGKSTLLQVISGHTAPDSGLLTWKTGDADIDKDHWFHYLSIAAPYIDLIDEYTVEEMIQFHFGFKKLMPATKIEDVAARALLATHTHKRVKMLSSGMKQRLKLTLAFLSQTPVVLVDEPTTNLDIQGKEWFAALLNQYAANRLVFIATNDSFDIQLCSRAIDVMAFKPVTV